MALESFYKMVKKAQDIDPEKWKAVEEAVLCFVRDRPKNRVLLIHKKRGLGAGLINAPGGRIESGETPQQAAIRETQEEVGLILTSPSLAGHLYFQFLDGYSLKASVFVTEYWEGSPIETDEADPFWCDESSIPYRDMWSDDSWWLPHLLAGRPFVGRFIFDSQKMLSMGLDVESAQKENGNCYGIPKLIS